MSSSFLTTKRFIKVRQTIPKSPHFVACQKQEVFSGTLLLQVVNSELEILKVVCEFRELDIK